MHRERWQQPAAHRVRPERSELEPRLAPWLHGLRQTTLRARSELPVLRVLLLSEAPPLSWRLQFHRGDEASRGVGQEPDSSSTIASFHNVLEMLRIAFDAFDRYDTPSSAFGGKCLFRRSLKDIPPNCQTQ